MDILLLTAGLNTDLFRTLQSCLTAFHFGLFRDVCRFKLKTLLRIFPRSRHDAVTNFTLEQPFSDMPRLIFYTRALFPGRFFFLSAQSRRYELHFLYTISFPLLSDKHIAITFCISFPSTPTVFQKNTQVVFFRLTF